LCALRRKGPRHFQGFRNYELRSVDGTVRRASARGNPWFPREPPPSCLVPAIAWGAALRRSPAPPTRRFWDRDMPNDLPRSMSARYDGLADWYDEEFQPAPLENATWAAVRRLLGRGVGALVDVGCGTGAYSAALAELGWNVTGVDVSEDMLARA